MLILVLCLEKYTLIGIRDDNDGEEEMIVFKTKN